MATHSFLTTSIRKSFRLVSAIRLQSLSTISTPASHNFTTTAKDHSNTNSQLPPSQQQEQQTQTSSPNINITPTSISNFINNDIVISDEMKSYYAANGFIIIPNALSAEHICLWRERVGNAVSARGIDHIFPNKDQMDATNVEFDYYHKVFTQRVNLWQNDSLMKELVLNAGNVIGKIACELEKIDKKSGMRLWHDQALYKESFANPTSFHCDVPFWSFDSLNAISCWVALDDVNKQNGCMYYMAGSHKELEKLENPFNEIKIGKNMNEIFEKYYPQCKECQCIAGEMKAGDIAFHNGLTIHGAGANFTNKKRRAMTFQMMPNGSSFNGKQNILTDQQVEKLNIGDLLNDPKQNVLLYAEKIL